MRKTLVILLLLCANSSTCQLASYFKADSTRKLFPTSYGTKKWKPLVGFDAYRSFYSGAPVKLNGFRIGLEYRGTHRFGFGFYGLKKDVIFTDVTTEHPLSTDTSLVKFKLNYSSFFYERVLYKTKKWELSLPLHLGGGGLEGYVEGSDGNYHRYAATSFSLITTGANVKYFVFPWLAPRFGTGVRFTFNGDKSLRKAFNGPYYAFGLSILVGELYKSIVKK